MTCEAYETFKLPSPVVPFTRIHWLLGTYERSVASAMVFTVLLFWY
jgi:hypothetical protein